MMKRKFGKLVFVNTNFYVKERRKFIMVKAIPLADFEADFFLYKNKFNFWSVVDGITGRRVTKFYKTAVLARKALTKNVAFLTPAQIESKLLLALKTTLLSPRYRFIARPSRHVAT